MSSARYRPVSPLATGGMGQLWMGVLEGAEGYRKPVVLKLAICGVEEDLDAVRDALVREARVAASLSHPNVIHVYELVDSHDGLMMAMEYLPGVALSTLLRHLRKEELRLPEPVAARIAADAARGLAHAHGEGSAVPRASVVHGDICPDNLVVTEGGVTKVIDFGVARRMGAPVAQDAVRTHLHYAAPELLSAQPVPASDVYALGHVLHELLSGGLRAREGLPATAVLPESTHPILRSLVERMLVEGVGRRTISMSEVADSLDDLASRSLEVSRFLDAELGASLAARRERLEAQLSAPEPAPDQIMTAATVTAVHGETSTACLLEHFFDVDTTEVDPPKF